MFEELDTILSERQMAMGHRHAPQHYSEETEMERRVCENEAWVDSIRATVEEGGWYQGIGGDHSPLPPPEQAWIRRAENGEFGADITFLCVFAKRFRLPVPTPNTFAPLMAGGYRGAGGVVFVIPHRILIQLGLDTPKAITALSTRDLEEAAARILYTAHISPSQPYLDAYARVLSVVPTVCVRLMRAERAAELNLTPPGWYKSDTPYVYFLQVCAELMAGSDWQCHRHMTLSGELLHLKKCIEQTDKIESPFGSEVGE
jgi:hypothetical protein